jgi:predicted metal-dependent phosphoesterase TrpH
MDSGGVTQGFTRTLRMDATADLHIHSTASDGTLSPTRIVEIAEELGLSVISLTDHDSIDGIEEALRAARGRRVTVIPGVELSCVREGRDIHMLGYFINWRNERFRAYLGELQRMRLERIRAMIGRLSERGLELALEDVLNETGHRTTSIGRPHIARAMVRKGLLHSVEDAFARYLGRGAPCFVEKYEHDPVEVIGVIREAGGVAVLAHPGLGISDGLIEELAGAGLSGIEVYHSDHAPEVVRRLLRLARKLGLVVTGGSDCHGVGSEKGLRIGSVVVEARALFAYAPDR